MNNAASLPRRLPVARLVRHRGVLRALFAPRSSELTIRELALRSRVPYATTWRIVEDLRRLGALRVGLVGSSRVVSVNPESPLLGDLRQIAAVEFAPHRHAARRFAELAARVHAVRRVILFGSVSRGEETVGSDVDVAVIIERRTKEMLDALDRLTIKVQDETGLPVIPIPVTLRQLARGGSFPRTLDAGEILYERP